MRTTGDETTDSRPVGDENVAGQGAAGDSSPTQVSVEPGGPGGPGGGGPEEAGPGDSDPTGGSPTPVSVDPSGEPPSPSADDLGSSGDTVDVDEVFGDLSEEEAEEVVTEVFETAYGDDADGILGQIQDTLGLDFRQILDILVGSSSDDPEDDAYGEGAVDEEVVDSSVGSIDDGTGTFGGDLDELDETDQESRFLVDGTDEPVDGLTGADAWDTGDETTDADSLDVEPGAGSADDPTPDLG